MSEDYDFSDLSDHKVLSCYEDCVLSRDKSNKIRNKTLYAALLIELKNRGL